MFFNQQIICVYDIQNKSVSKAQTTLANLVLGSSWTVPIRKKSRIIIRNSSIYKKSIVSIIIKEQNISNQNSILIGLIRFLGSCKLMYPVFYLKPYGQFDFQ